MSDLIDRQAAIDALADYIHNVDKVMGTGHLNADDCKDAAASVFEELPSAEPKRKKGKWIKENCRGQAYKCSACGNYLDFRGVNAGRGDANFCPNCGADMRGVKDE